MGEIIDFSRFNPEEADIYGMSREELERCLAQVRALIGALDGREPADMLSGEYDGWADEHEKLEDLADEIQDLLDEL